MILSVLFVCAVAAELFLFLGKDYLLGTQRRTGLEVALRQSYADLKESKRRLADARSVLVAAIDEAEKQRAQLQEADRAFKDAQKILPSLIYTLGDRGLGTRFRAAITKRLPETPERSQELIWSCKNFVDVWAYDVEAARQIATSQFTAKRQYAIGDFVAMPKSDPLPAAQEKAA